MSSASERLRLACDACHAAKARCSKGVPCAQCAQTGVPCIYSPPNPLGRPKGSKSKHRRGTSTAQSIMVAPSAVEQPQQPQPQPPPPSRNDEDAGLETTLAWKSWLPGEDTNSQNGGGGGGGGGRGLDECLFGQQPLLSDPNPNSLMPSLADPHSHPQTPHASSTSPAPSTFFTEPTDSNAQHGSVLSGQHASAPMAAVTHFSSHMDPPSPESVYNGQPTCTCVSEHVRLLYRLQHGNDGYMTSTDFLAAARQALDHWNTLMLCVVCSAQHDQHPWLLSVMSMRALTRLRHRLPESRSLRVAVGTFDVTGEDQQAIVTLLANKANERLGEALAFTERLIEQRAATKQP